MCEIFCVNIASKTYNLVHTIFPLTECWSSWSSDVIMSLHNSIYNTNAYFVYMEQTLQDFSTICCILNLLATFRLFPKTG